jgi:hypothetical protein
VVLRDDENDRLMNRTTRDISPPDENVQSSGVHAPKGGGR